MTVLDDPVEETRRILAAAEDAAVLLRAVGGIGIALRSPSIRLLDPSRSYHDIDLAAPSGAAAATNLLAGAGYEPARRFNALNGSERLLFHDVNGRRVDVFIDSLRMCHELRFGHRLALDAGTLPLADLALSKLQIVELTPRDAHDLGALLADHPLVESDDGGIDLRRIREVCAADWGWWRTVTGNLDRLAAEWRAGSDDGSERGRRLAMAAGRAGELRADLEAAPKSARWRMRAAIGERIAWYDTPEEVR